MNTRRWLIAGSVMAIAMTVAGVQPAQAEPLTPPTQAELQYLNQARQVFSVSRDNAAFRGDGELLVAGRYVCQQRNNGLVGYEATLASPIITQLAFIYLCPT